MKCGISKPEVATTKRANYWNRLNHVIDVPEEFIGVVTEAMGRRRWLKMINNGTGRVRLEI